MNEQSPNYQDLIQSYSNPKLANFLHLPVQSGSNRILELMKRKHTVESYIAKIHELKKIRPNISISSDFIVGFPSETEDDFQQTISLIETIGFDQSFLESLFSFRLLSFSRIESVVFINRFSYCTRE